MIFHRLHKASVSNSQSQPLCCERLACGCSGFSSIWSWAGMPLARRPFNLTNQEQLPPTGPLSCFVVGQDQWWYSPLSRGLPTNHELNELGVSFFSVWGEAVIASGCRHHGLNAAETDALHSVFHSFLNLTVENPSCNQGAMETCHENNHRHFANHRIKFYFFDNWFGWFLRCLCTAGWTSCGGLGSWYRFKWHWSQNFQPMHQRTYAYLAKPQRFKSSNFFKEFNGIAKSPGGPPQPLTCLSH